MHEQANGSITGKAIDELDAGVSRLSSGTPVLSVVALLDEGILTAQKFLREKEAQMRQEGEQQQQQQRPPAQAQPSTAAMPAPSVGSITGMAPAISARLVPLGMTEAQMLQTAIETSMGERPPRQQRQQVRPKAEER